MKIVGFVGSPRKKGNTTSIVNEVLRGASETGAETKIFNLNELAIRGCQACYKCQTPEAGCVQTDGMALLYDEIFSADAVVIGTPVFMFQITGQTKTFIDRLFALLYLKDGKPGAFRNKIKGKKTVTLYFQAQPETGLFGSQFDLNENVLAFLGFKVEGRIVAGGMSSLDSAKGSQSVMDQAYKAGTELVK